MFTRPQDHSPRCAQWVVVAAALALCTFAGAVSAIASNDLPRLTYPEIARTAPAGKVGSVVRFEPRRAFEQVGRSGTGAGTVSTPPAKTPIEATSTSHMVVNDNWVVLPNGTIVTVGFASYKIGTDAFAAIQPAINAVNPGGIVDVLPGVYSETAANSFLYDASGPYTFGLFFAKAKGAIKLRGVTATGVVITSAAATQATITTNSDANFGPDGFFVEGDGVTISGLVVSTNSLGTNKTMEIAGDNFTLKNCKISDNEGSVYFNDWQYDGINNISHILTYHVTGNIFQAGNSVDITSGAGLSGPASGRVISGNTFNNVAGETWPMISFNGSNTGVPWFIYSVGGAVITGNTFTNTEPLGQHIRARGTYNNSQYDWASYWNSNTFDRGVVVGVAPPADLRTFVVAGFYGNYNDVRHISSAIQPEVDHGVTGDIVLAKAGLYPEQVTVSTALTLKGANAGACAANGGPRGAESTIDGSSVDAAVVILEDNVTLDGFEVIQGLNGLNAGIWMSASKQNMTIKNNVITDNTIGVYANCAGASDISCNLISMNNAPGPAGGTGIYSEFTAGMNIHNNEITGHTDNNPVVFAATGPGVHTGLSFVSNNVHDNSFGLFALAVNGGLFSGNTITTAGGATGLTLGGNCSAIEVRDNFIDANLRGVRVFDYGYVSPGANSNIKVNHNNLVNDSEFGVGQLGGYSGPGQLDATCNWYGDISGPNAPLNPSGTGSAVTGTTAFYPWLNGSIAGAPLCNQTINWTITSTQGAGGTISPLGAQPVPDGSSQAYSIVANSCYVIADVKVDGISVGATGSYTFTGVNANHTIDAAFVPARYSITASGGAGGTITPAGTLASNVVAYDVPPTTVGSQTWTGALGMDFDVTSAVVVTQLGAFDSGSDGLAAPISVRLYDRDTATPVPGGTILFNTGEGTLVGGSRFKALASAITLPAGFHGSIVADGYGALEPNGNSSGGATAWTTNGGGAISFVGSSRYDNAAGGYPLTLDTGPVNRYAAGTFMFDDGTVACGADQSFTITPGNCYTLGTLTVDGNPVAIANSYTFTNVQANHTIAATFAPSGPSTITTSSSAGGSIAPVNPSVACGADQKVTITADDCYTLTGLTVDGNAVGLTASYTFTNVHGDHTIAAVFTPNGSYTITTVAGAGGSVTPSNPAAACGADQKINITADDCYSLATLLVDGNPVPLAASYTFTNVHTTHTLAATFSLNGPYTISTTAGAGGTITPPNPSVACGADQKINITPDDCHSVATLTVDGNAVGAATTYTFTNVHGSHTIAATFSLDGPYTISTSSGPNGTVTPANPSVACGADQKIAITAAVGYGINTLTVDGNAVPPVASYTFSNVHANHTIAATFKDVTPPQVTVIFPNGGENFLLGSDLKMLWTATDNAGPIANVSLWVSRDYGATYTVIAPSTPNDGTFVWKAESPTNTGPNAVYSALFKVVAVDATGNSGEDASDAPFSIFDYTTSVVLTQLDAERVATGIQIKWDLQARGVFSSVSLERAENEVGPWLPVAAELRDEAGVTVALDRTAVADQGYWYRLIGTTNAGSTAVFGPVQGSKSAPREFALSSAWPNPSRGSLKLEFAVAKDAPVRLSVLDVQGREVVMLANGAFKAGRYQIAWDGKSDHGAVPTGIYFVRFSAAGKEIVRRIVMER